ncbi:hypothetical protein [Leptotrichia trevisanii]
MVSEILKSAREAIHSMWDGLCTAFESEKSKDRYGIVSSEKVEICKNVPCRLSFKNISQAEQTGLGANVSQVVKLFISPEVYIPPGSTIEVTQNNVTRRYKHSGISAVYTNHQEIILEAEQEKA